MIIGFVENGADLQKFVGGDQLNDLVIYYNGAGQIENTNEICNYVAAVAFCRLSELRNYCKEREFAIKKKHGIDIGSRPVDALDLEPVTINPLPGSQKQGYQPKSEQDKAPLKALEEGKAAREKSEALLQVVMEKSEALLRAEREKSDDIRQVEKGKFEALLQAEREKSEALRKVEMEKSEEKGKFEALLQAEREKSEALHKAEVEKSEAVKTEREKYENLLLKINAEKEEALRKKCEDLEAMIEEIKEPLYKKSEDLEVKEYELKHKKLHGELYNKSCNCMIY